MLQGGFSDGTRETDGLHPSVGSAAEKQVSSGLGEAQKKGAPDVPIRIGDLNG